MKWFDTDAAVKNNPEGEKDTFPLRPHANHANRANRQESDVCGLARLARLAAPQPEIVKTEPDDVVLLDLLKTAGPMSYGAAAASLGWGATRTGQAEGALKDQGLGCYDALGRATLVPAR